MVGGGCVGIRAFFPSSYELKEGIGKWTNAYIEIVVFAAIGKRNLSCKYDNFYFCGWELELELELGVSK